jgi:hypothetical protein
MNLEERHTAFGDIDTPPGYRWFTRLGYPIGVLLVALGPFSAYVEIKERMQFDAGMTEVQATVTEVREWPHRSEYGVEYGFAAAQPDRPGQITYAETRWVGAGDHLKYREGHSTAVIYANNDPRLSRLKAEGLPAGVGFFARNVLAMLGGVALIALSYLISPPDIKAVQGYSRATFGGNITKYRELYKTILRSIVPQDMLTRDSLLKTPLGVGEAIRIITPEPSTGLQRLSSTTHETGQASYEGHLAYKVLKHLLNKSRGEFSALENEVLDEFIAQNIQSAEDRDTIHLREGQVESVLAHETFHDIQGFLYDYYPQIMDKLSLALASQKDAIATWYKDPANKAFTGIGNYQFQHLFPESSSDSPYSDGYDMSEAARFALRERKKRVGEKKFLV